MTHIKLPPEWFLWKPNKYKTGRSPNLYVINGIIDTQHLGMIQEFNGSYSMHTPNSNSEYFCCIDFNDDLDALSFKIKYM